MDLPNDVSIYICSDNATKSASYHVTGQYMHGATTGFIITDKLASPIQSSNDAISMEIESSGVYLSSSKKQKPLTEQEHVAMENAFFNSVTRVSKGRLVAN